MNRSLQYGLLIGRGTLRILTLYAFVGESGLFWR